MAVGMRPDKVNKFLNKRREREDMIVHWGMIALLRKHIEFNQRLRDTPWNFGYMTMIDSELTFPEFRRGNSSGQHNTSTVYSQWQQQGHHAKGVPQSAKFLKHIARIDFPGQIYEKPQLSHMDTFRPVEVTWGSEQEWPLDMRVSKSLRKEGHSSQQLQPDNLHS